MRSTVRILTRRRLLEWTTASEAESTSRTGLLASYDHVERTSHRARSCSFGAAQNPAALAVAAPVLLLWLPRPRSPGGRAGRRPPATQLSADDVVFLRKTARKTWAFFDDFVAAEDHHLPPDNYQEQPARVIAHRTSPTNMGLSLLANVTAYDFGYVAVGPLLKRTEQTFATLQRLERYQGISTTGTTRRRSSRSHRTMCRPSIAETSPVI